MKVGILGTGFGAYHAELFSQIKEVDTIYVFGRNHGKLEELKERLGIFPVTNISEIIENEEIELVDICLPNELHYTYVIQALEHNKHVLCETPVALNVAEAITMQKAQQKSGKLLMVDLFMRFEHAYQILADIVKSGTYGKLQKLQIQRNTAPIWGNLGPNNIVNSFMIHDIDFVSYILGTPNSIQSATTLGNEKACSVSLLFNYGPVFAEINASSTMPIGYPFAVSYEAILEHAVVRYYEDRYSDYYNHIDSKLTLYTPNSFKDIIPHNNCYFEMVRYVVNAVQSSKTPINSIHAAIQSLEITTRVQELIVSQN